MAIKRIFDQPHEFHGSFNASVESSTVNYQTIIPIIMNDDALGDPMSNNVHPEHASWAQSVNPNCYPDSHVKNMKIIVDLIVPKALGAALPKVSVDYAFISCAFPEDLNALDEGTGFTIKTLLELQSESTDRQCYPLFTTVDLANASLQGSLVPGLDTDQKLEAVAFSVEALKDQRRYGMLKGLLRKLLPIGLRTAVVTNSYASGGHKRLTFKFIPKNTKFINPYTFLGLFLKVRQMAEQNAIDPSNDQLGNITDTTLNGTPMIIAYHIQYDESNPEFHMAKI